MNIVAISRLAAPACAAVAAWCGRAPRRGTRALSPGLLSPGPLASGPPGRGRASTGRRARRAVSRPGDVPATLDLLAACVSAGATLSGALPAVAGSFDPPTRDLLHGVARLTALGADPPAAWAALLADPAWSAAARAVVRAQESGAAIAETLNRIADERRRELRSDAHAAAARAGVRAVLPLGVCFLPAFVLVGVVPVAVGFARSLIG
jgi:pilus assembly protein TadC